MNENKNIKKLFLISNQGLHPIENKLKRQFGSEINIEIITTGNVELNMRYAEFVAKKVNDVILKNDIDEIFIVWSGMPIYNNVVYNVCKDSLNKNPIYLVWDKNVSKYVEFDINSRRLVFGEYYKEV